MAPGVTSTLLLFNGDSTAQKVNLRFGTPSGPWMRRFTLEPMETRAININELVGMQEKDDSGLALPSNAQSGELGWQSDSTWVSGRLLQTSASLGMARSFSCSQWVYACSFYLSPTPSLTLFLNNTGNLSEIPDWAVYTGFHPPTTCSCANPSSRNTTIVDNWQSGNTSIATITSGGTSSASVWQGVGVGGTTSYFYGNNMFLGGGSLMCGAQQPAVVSPVINWNGKAINGTTQNVVVGQKIALTASYTPPAGLSVKSQTWTVQGTVQGKVIANYVQTSGTSTITAYTPPAQPSTTFYWIDGGTNLAGVNNTVTYSIILSDNSGPFTATATFSVFRPIFSFSSTTGTVVLCPSNCPAPQAPELVFGSVASRVSTGRLP